MAKRNPFSKGAWAGALAAGVLAAGISWTSQHVPATPEVLDPIDQVIHQAIHDRLVPGAVVLISHKGTIVKHKAYGQAYCYVDDKLTPASQPRPMKKETIFDIASISKVFTATAVLKLVEEGKLELDDPVMKYLPPFGQNGKSEATIRHLLTHTSGFPAWVPVYKMGDNREERLLAVFGYSPGEKPGKQYTYSDLNLITLGALVERVTGKGLDEYIKAEITDPLGMKDTGYNPSWMQKRRTAATEYQPSVRRGMVWGEVHDENAWSLGGVAGHAGLFSTAHDLAVFSHMMLNGGISDGKRILKPETVKLLTENQLPQFPKDAHGLGWEVGQDWYMDTQSDPASYGHTGFTGTSLVISPSQETVVILLTNRVHPTRETASINALRRQVARLASEMVAAS